MSVKTDLREGAEGIAATMQAMIDRLNAPDAPAVISTATEALTSMAMKLMAKE